VSNDDFIRTTRARHHATVQEFPPADLRQRLHRARHLPGLYCVSCEDYYNRRAAGRRQVPGPRPPVIEMQEDNYFFKLSAFGATLIEWYESALTAVRPRAAQRGPQFHPGRAARHLHHPHVLDWGRAGPLGRAPRLLRLVRRAHQLPHRLGYGMTRSASRMVARRHHLIGKEILRFHCVWWPAMCMAAGTTHRARLRPRLAARSAVRSCPSRWSPLVPRRAKVGQADR